MKKRIGLLVLSIVLVLLVLVSSTYSLLFKVDETEQYSYTTGMLTVTSESTNNSITLSNSLPMSDTDGEGSAPYTFKITNNGNLNFKFNVKLLSTTDASSMIDSQYIKVKINDNDVVQLSELTNGIIFEDATLKPNESVDFTLRVWLREDTPNSQIGKSFNGIITTEGQAIYASDSSGNNTEYSAAYLTLSNLNLLDSIKTDTPTFSKTSCSEGCEEATVGIYKTVDDLGESYYFRGDVENNYVKFGQNSSGADMYWRIIRINGDGSIRMIYDGTSAYENGVSNIDRVVAKVIYNSNTVDNSFVGYMNGTSDGTNFPNGTTNSISYSEAHTNITNSTIKTYLEKDSSNDLGWYKINIDNTNNTDIIQYIVDGIFCNDRSLSTNSSSVDSYGFEAIISYYGPRDRVANGEGSLICERDLDRFTLEDGDVEGNDKLAYPIGLITADEVILAGGIKNSGSGTNTKFYLYTGYIYWTMSPYGFASSYPRVYYVNGSGKLHYNAVSISSYYLKPVINISVDALQYGSGLASDPFRISE